MEEALDIGGYLRYALLLARSDKFTQGLKTL